MSAYVSSSSACSAPRQPALLTLPDRPSTTRAARRPSLSTLRTAAVVSAVMCFGVRIKERCLGAQEGADELLDLLRRLTDRHLFDELLTIAERQLADEALDPWDLRAVH